MKTNLLKLVALLSLIAPLAGYAMSITYDVNRMVGTGTVTGSITTDGTIGLLTGTSITDFTIAISDGTTTRQINYADGATVTLSVVASFEATLSEILWDVFGVGALTFQSQAGDRWQMGFDAELAEAPGEFSLFQTFPCCTIDVLATAQVTGLPEPGTLGLALIGLAGLVFSRKRKQRQSAAV